MHVAGDVIHRANHPGTHGSHPSRYSGCPYRHHSPHAEARQAEQWRNIVIWLRSMTQESYKPFKRCMVLGGGGFRFGIYIGMYAALRQADKAPDVLLASCGGAIAATIIHNLPDPQAQRAWLASPEMYAFWCSLKSTRRAALAGSLLRAAKRKLSTARAP